LPKQARRYFPHGLSGIKKRKETNCKTRRKTQNVNEPVSIFFRIHSHKKQPVMMCQQAKKAVLQQKKPLVLIFELQKGRY
jgi:hypothetical protein